MLSLNVCESKHRAASYTIHSISHHRVGFPLLLEYMPIVLGSSSYTTVVLLLAGPVLLLAPGQDPSPVSGGHLYAMTHGPFPHHLTYTSLCILPTSLHLQQCYSSTGLSQITQDRVTLCQDTEFCLQNPLCWVR